MFLSVMGLMLFENFLAICANAWWAVMHRFLPVHLSVCPPDQKSLENNSPEKFITREPLEVGSPNLVWWWTFTIRSKVTWIKVRGHMGRGQIRVPNKKVGGLTTASSCMIYNFFDIYLYKMSHGSRSKVTRAKVKLRSSCFIKYCYGLSQPSSNIRPPCFNP